MTDNQDALRLADLLEEWSKPFKEERHQAAAELRRLHAENEALRTDRDNLQIEVLNLKGDNAELVEALREIEPILARMYGAQYRLYLQPMQIVRGALAKVEASK